MNYRNNKSAEKKLKQQCIEPMQLIVHLQSEFLSSAFVVTMETADTSYDSQ